MAKEYFNHVSLTFGVVQTVQCILSSGELIKILWHVTPTISEELRVLVRVEIIHMLKFKPRTVEKNSS